MEEKKFQEIARFSYEETLQSLHESLYAKEEPYRENPLQTEAQHKSAHLKRTEKEMSAYLEKFAKGFRCLLAELREKGQL